MSESKTAALFVHVFFTAALFSASLSVAGELRCHKINTVITTSFLPVDQCPGSPVQTCTAGVIRSGLLKGSTSYDAFGIAESAGLSVEPATTIPYGGELVITTQRGIVAFSDVGVLDQFVGIFSELDRVTYGTGFFEGASGNLFIIGHLKEGGSGFVGTVVGEICIPK